MTWEQAPEDVMRLVFKCIAGAGIRRVWAIDPLNNMDVAVKVAGWCKDGGIEEVVVGIVYAVSPVHTDEYFAAAAREVAASPHVDVLNLKDPGGLLTPDRIRALMPILREAAGPDMPVEVHSHCTAAMAPMVYLEAAELGADFICTAAEPLSNGTSQPSVEQTIANLRTRGFETGLDEEAIARVSSHFREVAARLGLPVGRAGRARRLALRAPAARRHDHDAPAPPRGGRVRRPLGGPARRGRARARRARLPAHGHADLPVHLRAGGPQRHRGALGAAPGRARQVRARPVRHRRPARSTRT